MKRSSRYIALTLTTLLAAQLTPSSVRAHEEGVLTLSSPTAREGSTLTVKGADFSRLTAYVLVLKGALRSFELGRVTSDTAGSFEIELSLPAAANPGSYRVAALAPDGDEVSVVDLEIEAAPVSLVKEEEPGGEVAGAHAGPSAEPLNIERDWSGVEWFVLGTLFGGALAGGLALLRRAGAET